MFGKLKGFFKGVGKEIKEAFTHKPKDPREVLQELWLQVEEFLAEAPDMAQRIKSEESGLRVLYSEEIPDKIRAIVDLVVQESHDVASRTNTDMGPLQEKLVSDQELFDRLCKFAMTNQPMGLLGVILENINVLIDGLRNVDTFLTFSTVFKPLNSLLQFCNTRNLSKKSCESFVHLLHTLAIKLESNVGLFHVFMDGKSVDASGGGGGDFIILVKLLDFLPMHGKCGDFSRTAFTMCLHVPMLQLGPYLARREDIIDRLVGQAGLYMDALPTTLEPLGIVAAPPGSRGSVKGGQQSPKDMEALKNFENWVLFCSAVTQSPHEEFVQKISAQWKSHLVDQYIVRSLEDGRQDSVMTALYYLQKMVENIESAPLMDAVVLALLGNASEPEVPEDRKCKPAVRRLLLQKIGDMEQSVGVRALMVVNALLSRNYAPILENLVLRNLRPWYEREGDVPLSWDDVFDRVGTLSACFDAFLMAVDCPDRIPSSRKREELRALQDVTSLLQLAGFHPGEEAQYMEDAEHRWESRAGMIRARSISTGESSTGASKEGSELFEGELLRSLFQGLETFVDNDIKYNLALTDALCSLASFPVPLLQAYLWGSGNPSASASPSLLGTVHKVSDHIVSLSSQLEGFDMKFARIECQNGLRPSCSTYRTWSAREFEEANKLPVAERRLMHNVFLWNEFRKELLSLATVSSLRCLPA